MAKIEADRSSVKKEMQDATVAAAATTHDDGAKLAAGAVPTMNSAMKGNLATHGAAVLAKGSGPATTIPQQSVPQRASPHPSRGWHSAPSPSTPSFRTLNRDGPRG